MFGAAVLVWLVGLIVSTTVSLSRESSDDLIAPHGRPGQLAQMFLGRPAFEALAALRRAPTLCATVERTLQAVLVLAMAAWLVVGAVWVWPLHANPHHCNPSFVAISFYITIGLVVVLFAVAIIACMLCTCLVACGLNLRGAVDGFVEMIHGLLTLNDEPSRSRGGAKAGGAESGGGMPEIRFSEAEEGVIPPAPVTASASGDDVGERDALIQRQDAARRR